MEVMTLQAQMRSMQEFMQEMARSLGHPILAHLVPTEFFPQGTHKSCMDIHLSDGAGCAGSGLEDRGASDGDELGGSVLGGDDGGGDNGLRANDGGGDDGLGGTGRGDDNDGDDSDGGDSDGDGLGAFFDEIKQLSGDADCA